MHPLEAAHFACFALSDWLAHRTAETAWQQGQEAVGWVGVPRCARSHDSSAAPASRVWYCWAVSCAAVRCSNQEKRCCPGRLVGLPGARAASWLGDQQAPGREPLPLTAGCSRRPGCLLASITRYAFLHSAQRLNNRSTVPEALQLLGSLRLPLGRQQFHACHHPRPAARALRCPELSRGGHAQMMPVHSAGWLALAPAVGAGGGAVACAAG